MDKPENVRLAEPEDIEAIFWSLLRTYSEDNDLGIPISPMAVFRKVEALCHRQGGIAGVIDGPHGVVASIALQSVPFWFGYDERPFITEIWCYVVKQYRKEGRFLFDLFNFADWHREDMSAQLGYDIVLENAVLSLNRLPAMMRLYEQFYGAPTGGVFWSRGEGQRDVLQQQQQQDVGADDSAEYGGHDGADDSPVKPSGSGLLQRPGRASADAGEPASSAVHRPTRRAAEFDPEHGDSGHPERPRNRTTIFD
jgi:hypothetical protein